MGGAPYPYDPEFGEWLCEQLVDDIDGLAVVLQRAKDSGQFQRVPGPRTVNRWREKHPEFQALYRQAREMRAALDIDEAIKIARRPMVGKIVTEDEVRGKTVKTVDNVQRSQLIVQALFKRAALFAPWLYSERLAVAGVPDAPIQHKVDAGALIERIIGNRTLAVDNSGDGATPKPN